MKHYLVRYVKYRRYLYGNLNKEMISAYLTGRSNHIFFKGIMSFYPIINNVNQLKELEGWLVNAIFKSVQKRKKMLDAHSLPRGHIYPFKASRKEFLMFCNTTKVGKKKLLKIPSFMTIYQAMKKCLIEIGIAGITDPMADSYDY